jgi:ribosomal protein S18 acetylase RimI-like enzyme
MQVEPSAPSLRLAGPDDPGWVIDRHRVWYAQEFGFDDTFGDAIAARMVEFFGFENGFKRLWIAELDGNRVGSIAISSRPGNAAFLNFVLVDPSLRRRGIAAILMDTALDHARANGIGVVRLMTYNCLTGARALYDRLGFRIVEVTPDHSQFGKTFDLEFWELRLND